MLTLKVQSLLETTLCVYFFPSFLLSFFPPSSFLLSRLLSSFLSLLTLPLPHLRDLTPEGNLLGRLLFGSSFGPSGAPDSPLLPSLLLFPPPPSLLSSLPSSPLPPPPPVSRNFKTPPPAPKKSRSWLAFGAGGSFSSRIPVQRE